MQEKPVNIDFEKMAVAFRSQVRLKAFKAGGSIVYLKDGKLIEENLQKAKIRVLQLNH